MSAISKKIENHAYATTLDFLYYNFARVHETLKVMPLNDLTRDRAVVGGRRHSECAGGLGID
jgi:hypothetical protein